MTGDKEINNLLTTVDKGLATFDEVIPEIQNRIYSKLVEFQRELDVSGGTLQNTAKNIRLLGRLKSELQKIILDDADYLEAVTQFGKLYEKVDTLNLNYFKSLEKKFKPPEIVSAVREQSVGILLEQLTEGGMDANIISPIREVINTYVTTGGSYAKLSEELGNYIKGYQSNAGPVDGVLLKYTKQITTDAINQYSATVNDLMTKDLGWEWFRYQGSDRKTTRTFCKALKDKKYFHRSELPNIIKGNFTEFQNLNGKIYAKTGLPQGMIDDTNTSNFMVYRGGYNCGHQVYPIPAALVPANIRALITG